MIMLSSPSLNLTFEGLASADRSLHCPVPDRPLDRGRVRGWNQQ